MGLDTKRFSKNEHKKQNKNEVQIEPHFLFEHKKATKTCMCVKIVSCRALSCLRLISVGSNGGEIILMLFSFRFAFIRREAGASNPPYNS